MTGGESFQDMKMTIGIAILGAALASGCKFDTMQAAAPGVAPSAQATPPAGNTATKWKTIEEFNYAWKPGQAPAHFKLELPEGYEDPGDFTRIHIQVKGQPEFVLTNEDGWIAYNSQEQQSDVYAKLKKQNLAQSKYALLLPDSTRAGEPLVFLRSWVYASDAERLHVIGFKPSGEPISLLNTELDLEAVADLDGDGHPEIVGMPCMSQEWGPGFLTYDPHHVYQVPHPITGPAKLSVELSKAYNLKHYYGWAGPDCSEKLVVVLHPPSGGKPVIMDVAEAKKLMKQAPAKKK
jgi:hypothetical protein